MKHLIVLCLISMLTSCWPSSVGFKDTGGMPSEWQSFHLTTLNINAPNCPLYFGAQMSEKIKDGIQNKTRLSLATKKELAELKIEGIISSYQVNPIAIQSGDNASQNRLTISILFTIEANKPKEETFTLNSTRFADFDSKTNLSEVEAELLNTISEQVVQDVINKLMSNW